MDDSSRSLRVGLLIAAVALGDVVVHGTLPSGQLMSGMYPDLLLFALTASQIAALSIWVSFARGINPRRLSIAVIVGAVLAWLYLIRIGHFDKRPYVWFSVTFVAEAIAVCLLFYAARIFGLRITARDKAAGEAEPPVQFSLLGLLAGTAIAGVLAAATKFAFKACDLDATWRDISVFLILWPTLTVLAAVAAWLAWGSRWAALRWLLIVAGICSCGWAIATPRSIRIVGFVLPFSSYLCLLWLYLWLFRRCGYVAVCQRRRSGVGSADAMATQHDRRGQA